MNRDLKFRVWEKGTNAFLAEHKDHYANYSWNYVDGALRVCVREYGEFAYWVDDCVIQQFTGLFDKNGKEVYDGDILKVTEEAGERLVKIEWFEFSWVAKVINPQFTTALYSLGTLNRRKNSEVVGNIFENSELLN